MDLSDALRRAKVRKVIVGTASPFNLTLRLRFAAQCVRPCSMHMHTPSLQHFVDAGAATSIRVRKKIDAYSQRMRVIVQGSLWRHKLYYPLRKANFNRYVRSNRSSPCNLPKHLSGSSSDQASPPASGSSASIESQPKWIGTFYPSS